MQVAKKSDEGSAEGAIDHALGDKAYVIADSLNYIKGYRYELYCMARTCKTRHCCVHVHCDDAVSNKWSSTRKELTGEGMTIRSLLTCDADTKCPMKGIDGTVPCLEDMTPLETKNTAVDAVNVDTISTEQKGGESQARVSSFRRKTSSGSSATTSTVLTLKKSTKNDSMGSSNPLVFNRLDERSSSSVSNACGSGHSRRVIT